MQTRQTRWDWISGLLLFVGNAVIVRDLFLVEYSRHMGSIESTHITLSRFIAAHFPDLSWFPLWYNGIPFQNAYPPLLHALVALYGVGAGASAALAHHAVTAGFYCLGPVMLFALARVLGSARTGALLAGISFSLVSFSAWLIPVVRNDVGGAWNARRLQALVQYGEGPHVASITLSMLALLLLHLALRSGGPWRYAAAALGLAAAPLTNWLGAFSLAAGVVAYLITAEPRERFHEIARTVALGIFAYLLACPWIPPSTLQAIRTNSQWMGGDFRIGWKSVASGLMLLAAAGAVAWLLRRWRVARITRFAAVFLLFMGGIVLPAEWWGWYIVPQPQRYHLQMELAISLLAGAAAAAALGSRKRAVVVIVALAVSAGVIWQTVHYRRYARALIGPVDVTGTIEYRAARWVDEHLNLRRVMMAGTVGFWLNAFTDTPQIAGGFDQGITNPLLPAVLFQVLSGMNAGDREAEVATLWLRAYGVRAVGVSGPRSTEVYKPFANPEKFTGYLEEVWREDDFRIYAVPHRSPYLAQVVPRKAIVAQRPRDVFDLDAVRRFVAAMEEDGAPTASLAWRNQHTAVMEARVPPGTVVATHITFHPGWKAAVTDHAGFRKTRVDAPAPLFEDGLGQMVVDPQCDGECTVILSYDGGFEMRLARVLCLVTVLGGLAWVVTSWWRIRSFA